MNQAEDHHTPDTLPRPLCVTGLGLVLREWRDDEVAALQELFDEPDVAARINFPWPFDAAAFLAMTNDARSDGRFYLAITADGNKPLGMILLFPSRAILGYMVGKAHRRQGLAVRSLRLTTDFCHDTLGIPRLTLPIYPHNTPSKAVARSAGYDRDGDTFIEVLTSTGQRAPAEVWTHQAGTVKAS
jgi:RimJ/RimL family protein N-acetyltransferase